MRRVKTQGTAPEISVRAMLHRSGIRYRTQAQDLPGTPDIVNRSRRWAIFVNGCFWHGHDCRWGRPAKKNAEFWHRKVESNRDRDASVRVALEALGYCVIVVWQCELRLPDQVRARLLEQLDPLSGRVPPDNGRPAPAPSTVDC
jgi:DNA mismatch endonuclease, patch repair protein